MVGLGRKDHIEICTQGGAETFPHCLLFEMGGVHEPVMGVSDEFLSMDEF